MDDKIKKNNVLIDNMRKELARVAIDCSAPFFWFRNFGKEPSDINNGTIFFLDTGHKQFAITAYHVYEGFLNSVKLDNETKAQITNEIFNPTINIIDYSKELDLITFQVDKSLVKNNGKRFFKGIQSTWPPAPPEKDKGVFFAGYPGNEKILEKNKTINWGIFSGLCIVKSITDKYISVQFEEEYVLDMPDKMPKNYNSAGISGAPLITMVENASGIYTWRLGASFMKPNMIMV